MELRYEDLVDQPSRELVRVCAFLELDFREAMLDYADRAPSAVLSREREQHRNLTKPVTRGLRNWRREMRPADVEVFEAVAGAELTAYGYERAFPEPSLSARAHARAGVQLDRQVRLAKGRARKVLRKVREAV
jgi:hypothetical protein